jgi:hypothetical protein
LGDDFISEIILGDDFISEIILGEDFFKKNLAKKILAKSAD